MTVLIDQLDASLTRSQYATIMSIIMDNFPEPWSVCPPVIEWPKRDPEVEEGVIRDPLKGRRTAQVRVIVGGAVATRLLLSLLPLLLLLLVLFLLIILTHIWLVRTTILCMLSPKIQ